MATDLSSIESAGYKPGGRIYAAELAVIVERTVHTIRQWDAQGLLPAAARPQRDSRGWRYWTPAQIDAIVTWIAQRQHQNYEKLAKLRSERFIDSELQKCPVCGQMKKDLDRHRRMQHGG